MQTNGQMTHAAATAVLTGLVARSFGVAAGIGLTILAVTALFGG